MPAIPNTEKTWWESLQDSVTYALGGTPEDDPAYQQVLTDRQGGALPTQTKPAVRTLKPAFEFGTPAAGKREILKPDAQTEVGTIYEITYKVLPIFQAWQRDKLLEKLRGDDRITLLHLEHWPEQNRITTQVIVEKTNPFPVIAVAAIAVSLALGIGIWLSATSIAKLTGFEVDVNGDGKPEFKGSGLILLGVALVALFVFVKVRK